MEIWVSRDVKKYEYFVLFILFPYYITSLIMADVISLPKISWEKKNQTVLLGRKKKQMQFLKKCAWKKTNLLKVSLKRLEYFADLAVPVLTSGQLDFMIL